MNNVNEYLELTTEEEKKEFIHNLNENDKIKLFKDLPKDNQTDYISNFSIENSEDIEILCNILNSNTDFCMKNLDFMHKLYEKFDIELKKCFLDNIDGQYLYDMLYGIFDETASDEEKENITKKQIDFFNDICLSEETEENQKILKNWKKCIEKLDLKDEEKINYLSEKLNEKQKSIYLSYIGEKLNSETKETQDSEADKLHGNLFSRIFHKIKNRNRSDIIKPGEFSMDSMITVTYYMTSAINITMTIEKLLKVINSENNKIKYFYNGKVVTNDYIIKTLLSSEEREKFEENNDKLEESQVNNNSPKISDDKSEEPKIGNASYTYHKHDEKGSEFISNENMIGITIEYANYMKQYIKQFGAEIKNADDVAKIIVSNGKTPIFDNLSKKECEFLSALYSELSKKNENIEEDSTSKGKSR